MKFEVWELRAIADGLEELTKIKVDVGTTAGVPFEMYIDGEPYSVKMNVDGNYVLVTA